MWEPELGDRIRHRGRVLVLQSVDWHLEALAGFGEPATLGLTFVDAGPAEGAGGQAVTRSGSQNVRPGGSQVTGLSEGV